MGDALTYLSGNLVGLIVGLVNLVEFLVVAAAVLSWLVAFNVINIRNPMAYRVVRTLDAVTSPLLRPIQRILPNLGGVDLSPVVLILLLELLKVLLRTVLIALVTG